ncbi:MAG: hypothetical protein WBW62_00845 [Solirubrobacterales bacterium]
MKRLTLSIVACSLISACVLVAGCGGTEQPTPDPGDLIDRAFAEDPSTLGFLGGGQVEVTSLGYEDAPLETRVIKVNSKDYAAILGAIAAPQKGLRSAISDLQYDGTETIDGLEVDRVTGMLDVAGLVDAIEKAGSPESELDRLDSGLPGSSQLSELEESLVDARFDLYVAEGGGSFEQLDLTIALDDRENALPPTRIRFSLTEAEPEETSP